MSDMGVYDYAMGMPESYGATEAPPAPAAPPTHSGPVVDDYASIGRRLKQIEAETAAGIQAHPLPEVGPVAATKAWWS